MHVRQSFCYGSVLLKPQVAPVGCVGDATSQLPAGGGSKASIGRHRPTHSMHSALAPAVHLSTYLPAFPPSLQAGHAGGPQIPPPIPAHIHTLTARLALALCRPQAGARAGAGPPPGPLLGRQTPKTPLPVPPAATVQAETPTPRPLSGPASQGALHGLLHDGRRSCSYCL